MILSTNGLKLLKQTKKKSKTEKMFAVKAKGTT